MGFLTPMYELGEYLKWTRDGTIQLPDFQRGYKWEDERIRQLLVTVLRGHPMGAVMLLKTGNSQVRFKPRALEGVDLAPDVEAKYLLLDGQQRLTSLTQALSGDGEVATKDARGKLLDRRYLVHMETALSGSDRVDEAVISVPADGLVKEDFGRTIVRDLSTLEKQRDQGYFPLHLLYGEYVDYLFDLDRDLGKAFHEEFIKPASTYDIPAISLDENTDKAAVATVFEKVNIGGLPLNVFELLTAVFAGDGEYLNRTGEDFRLNDDWHAIRNSWAQHPVLNAVENTDFLQAVTMLTTRERHLAATGERRPAISAKREDVLKLTLPDYLAWRDQLRDAFAWAATFLADRYVFGERWLPYPKQLVPLAAIKVVLGQDADLIGVKERLVRWYWCGILGELYGSASETRFARDLEAVPEWARDESRPVPRTISDSSFVESRLLSLTTRRAAAYRGLYTLLLANGARDWLEDTPFDKVQYAELDVDIHHIFPKAWCEANDIENERKESIVNKTAIGVRANRGIIGGAAPSSYVGSLEQHAQIAPETLDRLLCGHVIDPGALRSDDFDAFFDARREALCLLIERATGKEVQRDLSAGDASEDAAHFDSESLESDPED